MKTTEDFIRQMESGNILINNEHTLKEYANELLRFQKIVCELVAGGAYHEGMRIEEAQFIMESKARQKYRRSDPAVHKGIIAMRKLDKEIRVTMAGVNREGDVSRMLSYLSRPNTKILRNVYVTNGEEETELDNILLTDAGVIILEVKSVKSDLTLTEDGRLISGSDESFGKIPLGEKMEIKRRLLKEQLEKTLSNQGLNIPVVIDSFIVFCAPKGQYIQVHNRYRREKYCFLTSLNNRINSYVGAVNYSEGQLVTLGEILAAQEAGVKRFASDLDYDEIRRNIAEALVVLQDKPAVEVKHVVEQVAACDDAEAVKLDNRDECSDKTQIATTGRQVFYAAASVCAGLMISAAAALLSLNLRRV